MEYIQPVAKIIIDHLWDATARQVNYFAKIGDNMNDLRGKVEELKVLTVDLRREVERAKLEGKDPTNEVQGWLQDADGIINNVNVEETEEEFRLNKKCFFGWCLDCPSRYQLGKRIVKATQVVQNHRDKKNRLGVIAVLPLPVSELPATIIREKTSTMDTLDKVCNRLMDAKIGRIGIYGMGGVGKTTLMRNIKNKFCRTQHFEHVIFVTVSRDWNIKKLRNDIGKELYPEDKRETWDSKELFGRLMEKRFLLILDDMWVKVDLDELGVPTPEQNRGCKIVITTRDRGVCNAMVTDEEIEVKVLSGTEAWELFREQAGSVIRSDVERIARDVCKECHGLPLAIIVVGRALRKEADREVWENALRVLKTSQFELKGMEREVYSPLKFSYDHLETDTLRSCFLYCSLFPEDYPIYVDNLMEYWTMEGFIEGVDSLKDASAKGHYLLKELIDSCLLEKEYEDFVKMHDVIRDMAIKITSEITDQRGKRFLVRARVGLEECPEVEKWEGKDRISLIQNIIKSLPDEPKCTELSTLLLQGNIFLREISQSFFKQMENLRVLDLSGTDVVSLPPSISELRSLRALILRNCHSLESVTHVEGLEQLQLLDLKDSSIEELPREIGQLTRLRRLDLSCTSRLAHIPADTIVSLSLLEDLEMHRSSYFRKSDKGEALIENLRQLNHLSHFSAEIPNDLCTSSQWKFLLGDKLKTFRLQIGKILLNEPDRGRRLDITGNGNVSQAVGLIQYAEILHLYRHNEVRTISAMGACNLNRLKGCFVQQCNQLENVIITEEAEERILPNLEILVLHNLPNLRSIWKGNGTVPGSFGRIKNITLRDCNNVMHLFSSNVLHLLNSLEELNIISCPRMVEIVTGEVGNGAIALPKMRSILLYKLPKLNKMWDGILSLGSLREIKVISCTSLRQLAIDIEKTPALQVIRGEREWWDGLQWQNDTNKSHFQNIFKLAPDIIKDK